MRWKLADRCLSAVLNLYCSFVIKNQLSCQWIKPSLRILPEYTGLKLSKQQLTNSATSHTGDPSQLSFGLMSKQRHQEQSRDSVWGTPPLKWKLGTIRPFWLHWRFLSSCKTDARQRWVKTGTTLTKSKISFSKACTSASSLSRCRVNVCNRLASSFWTALVATGGLDRTFAFSTFRILRIR